MEIASCFRCEDPGTFLFASGPFGIRRCRNCRLVFTSPRLNPSERSKFYADGTAPYLQGLWTYPRLGLIGGFTKGKRLLDIGCGRGDFLDAAARSGYDASGIDVSPKTAISLIAKGLDARQGTAETLPSPPGMFDIVTFWEVLEHVPDPRKFLASVRTLLAPGGVAAFSMPDFGSSGSGWFKGSWYVLLPHQHLWHFTPDTVRKTMSEAGFNTEFLTTDPLNPCNFGRLDHMAGVARKA